MDWIDNFMLFFIFTFNFHLWVKRGILIQLYLYIARCNNVMKYIKNGKQTELCRITIYIFQSLRNIKLPHNIKTSTEMYLLILLNIAELIKVLKSNIKIMHFNRFVICLPYRTHLVASSNTGPQQFLLVKTNIEIVLTDIKTIFYLWI